MGVIRVSLPRDCVFPVKTETITAQGTQIKYTQEFCIEVTDDCIPAVNQILLEAEAGGSDPTNYILPALGDTYFFNGETDLDAIVTNRSPLTKGTCGRYRTTVTWSNPTATGSGSPTDPPENLYATVNVEFQEQTVPGDRWLYIGACDQFGNGYGPSFGGLIQNQNFYPPLATPFLFPGQLGPARNSAGCEKVKNKLKYRHILRVRTYAQSWNCLFSDLFGSCNSFATKIIEQDDTNVTFCCTYPAGTLEILNANKQVIDFFGTSIVCIEWLLEYNPDGPLCKILDAGTQAAFVPGVVDPTLAPPFGAILTVDDPRFDHNKTAKRDIDTRNEILLNGQGVEWCLDNNAGTNGQPIYLAYLDGDKNFFDFSQIPVSTFVPAPTP